MKKRAQPRRSTPESEKQIVVKQNVVSKVKGKSRSKGKSLSSDRAYNIPVTQTYYTGPAIPRVMKDSNETVVLLMALDTDVTASAGGVVANVVGSNPASFTNWTQMSAAYDEYRVLALKTCWEPYNMFNSSLANSPMYIVVDRADSTALTSYSDALQYGSVDKYNTGYPWSKTVKMAGVEDAVFTSVNTGYSAMYVKMYAGILTASMAIGRLATTVLVQFRSTK